MPNKVLDESICPSPNFNGTAIEVGEWLSNFIPQFIMHVIMYRRLEHSVCNWEVMGSSPTRDVLFSASWNFDSSRATLQQSKKSTHAHARLVFRVLNFATQNINF